MCFEMIFIHFLSSIMVTFSVTSYNSRARGRGRMDTIRQLCNESDFVLVQEHWLLPQNLATFQQISGIACHGFSAIDLEVLLIGRPFGGCSILYKTALDCKVSPADCGDSRVCAVRVDLESSSFLLFNVYMPTDTKSDMENVEVFDEVLSAISSISSDSPVDRIVVRGDFNTDFSRNASLHTRSLISFLNNECLCEPRNTIDYTFENIHSGDKSFIGHIFISANLADSVDSYVVSHLGDNLSDHSPITLMFDV